MKVRSRSSKVYILEYITDCLNKVGPFPGSFGGEYVYEVWGGVCYKYKKSISKNFFGKTITVSDKISYFLTKFTSDDGNPYVRIRKNTYLDHFDERNFDMLVKNLTKIIEHYSNYYKVNHDLEIYKGLDEIECPPNI